MLYVIENKYLFTYFYIKCKSLKPQREDSDQEQRALSLLSFVSLKTLWENWGNK